MGRRIRVFEPNVVYSVVIRSVDHSFVFKPDHNPKHPLLVSGCPLESFRPFNKIIPKPSVINVIGACAARAMELAHVRIHWVEANSTHLQVGISVSRWEDVGRIPEFFRDFHSAVAVKLGKKWHWSGHIFASPYHATPCLDEESVEQQLVYSVTNPVKDHLVERVLESPYFTTFRHLAQGKKLEYFRIDWDAYNKAGARRKKNHCPQNYLRWLELDITPVPGQEDWPAHKRNSFARAQIRAVEEQMKEELRKKGQRAMGAAAQFRLNPRGRPRDPKSSGPQPLCHCADHNMRAEYKERWREIVSDHRAASIEYLLGYWEREFPEGTFRPPLIKPYLSSQL